MKKLFFIVVALMTVSTSLVKAENNNEASEKEADYTFNLSMPALARYLDLDSKQYDAMAYASEDLKDGVERAQYARPEKQALRLSKAVYRNLAVAHKVMNSKQYKAYQSIFNRTLFNKGLAQIMAEYELAEK